MTQYHHHPPDLRYGRGTTAYWAVTPNRKLLVFVHGFGGDSTETWVQFPKLLALNPRMRECDAVFFGYDGLKQRAVSSAIQLLEMLTELATNTVAIINASLPFGAIPREAAFGWDQIVIVAHSLGAVVSRSALLMAHKRHDAWADRVRLVFFAPAHSGADILKLAGEALTGIPALLPFVKSRYPVLLDLEHDSPWLQYLRREVLAAIPAAPYLAAKAVFLAGNDSVVSPVPFIPNDASPPRSFPGLSHTEVCKPSVNFPDPVVELEALL